MESAEENSGKITVLKSLALSKLSHVAGNVTIPGDIIKKINKELFSFLWRKRDRIKRNVVYAPVGSLGMIDIESYFQSQNAKWAYRAWGNGEQNSAWNVLAKKYFKTFDLKCIQNFSFNNKKLFPQSEKVFQSFTGNSGRRKIKRTEFS